MAAGADILVEVRFERGAEFRQVQAAVDTAELVIGFEHPGGAPAQRHGPVPPALDVLGVLPANLDHRLDRVGRAERAGQGGRHAQSHDGQGLGHALAQRRGGAGVGLVQLAGQLGQQSLGLDRRGGVVGLAHPPLGDGAQPFGQLVPDIFDLVLLTSLDERLAGDVPDGAREGLGAIEDGEDGPGDIQAALAQPGDQVGDQGGVLGRAFLDGQRVLGPLNVDAERDDAGVLAEVHPVGHERDQVQPIQPAGHQLLQRGLSRGHEPAGHRRLAGGRGRLLDGLPGGLQAIAVAARRQSGEHLLQRQPAQDLGGGEQVIAGQVQLTGPVGGPHPRPLDGDAPPAHSDRPGPGAMPVTRAVRIVPAVRPAQPLGVLAEHGGHHLQPGPHSQGQQALLRRLGDLGHRYDHLLWDGDLLQQRAGPGTAAILLIGVAHGGPLPSSDDLAVARHLPPGRQRAGDRHSQVLRRPGHPLVFVVDDLLAWLVGLVADAGRKKLITRVLGTDQERALRPAVEAAVEATAAQLAPSGEQFEQLVMTVGEVFRGPPGVALAGQATLLEALQAGIAARLTVLDDPDVTGTGQSSMELLGVPGGVLPETLAGHLMREIMVCGSGGGPLARLAGMLAQVVSLVTTLAREDRGPGVLRKPVRLAPRPALLAGRQELLADLDTMLTGGGDRGPRIVTLCGLGGAGKTSVAIGYAHRHLGEVGVAWQFPAEDSTVLTAGFAELAAQLGAQGTAGAQDLVASVHAMLAAFPEDWLLVFDNVPDRAAVERFLPPAGPGRVLVTSRNPHWPPGQVLDVPVLDLEVAAGFLVTRTGDVNGQAARELAGELGGLPLALEQAGAYVEASGGSLAGYLGSFRRRRPEMLARGTPTGYDSTV